MNRLIQIQVESGRVYGLSHSGELWVCENNNWIKWPLPVITPEVISKGTVEDVERDYIASVLASEPTLELASKTLGLNLSTLWRKRKKYGLL